VLAAELVTKDPTARVLNSSSFRLNVSAFLWTGVHLAVV